MKTQNTKTMVMAAVLTALVLILQLLGSFIHLGPFSISLVLVPIVIGAASCGVGYGAWLGFVFGLAVLISGDASAFLAVNPMGTIITVLLKGTLCGLLAGIAYKIAAKKNTYLGVGVAAIVCPVVNTGIFLLGCLAFFMPTITMWATEMGLGENVGKYMIVVLVGGNFLAELIINVVLSPTIVRLLNVSRFKN